MTSVLPAARTLERERHLGDEHEVDLLARERRAGGDEAGVAPHQRPPPVTTRPTGLPTAVSASDGEGNGEATVLRGAKEVGSRLIPAAALRVPVRPTR